MPRAQFAIASSRLGATTEGTIVCRCVGSATTSSACVPVAGNLDWLPGLSGTTPSGSRWTTISTPGCTTAPGITSLKDWYSHRSFTASGILYGGPITAVWTSSPSWKKSAYAPGS